MLSRVCETKGRFCCFEEVFLKSANKKKGKKKVLRTLRVTNVAFGRFFLFLYPALAFWEKKTVDPFESKTNSTKLLCVNKHHMLLWSGLIESLIVEFVSGSISRLRWRSPQGN